ncbi:hypothetical protein AeNC1_016242 [Aphanomyces euteiches]|nr:hypothetical protein AeNC1_016242 [Aphanomyces euteiches]
MPELFCVVVGDKSPFPVDVALTETVGVLKDKIKQEKPIAIKCNAHKLQLYLALYDGAGLNCDDATALKLDDIKGYNEMNPTLAIAHKEHVGADFEPNEGEVYVLVVVPDETAPAPSYVSRGISLIYSICRWLYRQRVGHNCKAIISFMENQMTRKDTIISSPHLLQEDNLQFRLTGREDAIETAMQCYKSIIKCSKTTASDRHGRPIPVCSGISGLGKTRMLEEGAMILREILKENEFDCIASVIVPYYNEYMANPVEKTMSIEASFSWRLLYRFFLAGNCTLSFDEWVEKRLPSNGDQLTLTLALEDIQYKLSERLQNPPRLYLFLGIDEYLNIKNVKAPRSVPDTSLLRELVGIIVNVLCTQSSKFVLLPMFAGTDLHAISSNPSSSFVTQRLPMPLLNIQQVFSSVESVEGFADLLEYAQVCRNLFFLGGVPRWVVEYLLALKVVKDMQPQDSTEKVLPLTVIENCYRTITEKYVTSTFSVLNPRRRLRLAAFALSGRLVQPDELFDGKLTWSRLRDSSLCLLSPL